MSYVLAHAPREYAIARQMQLADEYQLALTDMASLREGDRAISFEVSHQKCLLHDSS